jgi:hypothetical protein
MRNSRLNLASTVRNSDKHSIKILRKYFQSKRTFVHHWKASKIFTEWGNTFFVVRRDYVVSTVTGSHVCAAMSDYKNVARIRNIRVHAQQAHDVEMRVAIWPSRRRFTKYQRRFDVVFMTLDRRQKPPTSLQRCFDVKYNMLSLPNSNYVNISPTWFLVIHHSRY